MPDPATASHVRHLTQRQNPTTRSISSGNKSTSGNRCALSGNFTLWLPFVGRPSARGQGWRGVLHADNNLIARLQTRTRIALCPMLMDSVVPRVQTIVLSSGASVIAPLSLVQLHNARSGVGLGKLAAMDVSGAQAVKLSSGSTTASGLSAVAALSR